MLAAGPCNGGHSEEQPRLPEAGHSQFQQGLLIIDPPQGAAEPISQTGGSLGKYIFVKAKNKKKEFLPPIY